MPCSFCDEAPVQETEDGKYFVRCRCGAETGLHDSYEAANQEWIDRYVPPKLPIPCRWGLHFGTWYDWDYERCIFCKTLIPLRKNF